MGEAKKAIREMEALTGSFGETFRLVEGAEVSLLEACSAIRDFERTLEADPERLSFVEERLDLISRLKKKYGETVEQVLSYRDALEDELKSLAGAEDNLDGLKAKISEAEASALIPRP